MYAIRLLLTVVSAAFALGPRQEADIVHGKYIISLKQDAEPPIVESHLSWVRELHGQSLARLEENGIDKVWKHSFKGYSGEFDEETIEKIRQSNDVFAVEPVMIVTPSAFSHNEDIITQEGAPWGLASISHRTPGETDFMYHESAGEGTVAYVIDSGIYIEHAEFEGRASLGYNALDVDHVDTAGHGTHVAGIIGSRLYGVAKKAELISVKIFGNEGALNTIVLDGIEWAVSDIKSKSREGLSVMNMAFDVQKSQAIDLAVGNAYTAGILSVVAAGNNGYNVRYYSPSSEPTAITVAASTRDNERLGFSNWGAGIDIFAAGLDVNSTYIGDENVSASESGTSMACAHVSGLALYLKALEGGLGSAQAITDRIKELGTKDVLEGLDPETREHSNLLAYNGVHEYSYAPTW